VRSAVTGKELPLLGGASCLDFVNTVDPRHEPPREDFLPGFAELADWGKYAGLLTASEKRAMLAESAACSAAASAVHRRAIELREALYRLFRAPERPPPDALTILNAELQRAAASVSVERRKGKYELAWRAQTVADRLLGAIARSAADLLTSQQLQYVRECVGGGCGWLFLDTSKAHQRRWCSMAVCGNRAKARRHRQRRQPATHPRRGAAGG
jgi:predicted RNA-binding Zn ribbon-like protein